MRRSASHPRRHHASVTCCGHPGHLNWNRTGKASHGRSATASRACSFRTITAVALTALMYFAKASFFEPLFPAVSTISLDDGSSKISAKVRLPLLSKAPAPSAGIPGQSSTELGRLSRSSAAVTSSTGTTAAVVRCAENPTNEAGGTVSKMLREAASIAHV